MTGDDWIIVPGWDKFQHYRDRHPVWIKVYVELRDKDEWTDLSYALRGLLVSIWIEYGACRGLLRVSKLAQKCGQSTRHQHLRSLSDAGFIQLSASKPLAQRREEKEKEKEENEPGRSRSKVKPKDPEPTANAAAYQPFQDQPPDVHVDQATLELIRSFKDKWAM
jgi:hypothetical protein